jgi:RHS repeat-associated protein
MTTAAQLSENSHQGFDGIKAALCLGSMEAKSNTASGMPVCLWQEGIGSRSSGKERDAETGLDYFGARYYSGAQGRFITPDWSSTPQPVPYADFSDPQTLNLYAYVRNNPIATADLDGHGFWKKLGNLISYGEWTDDEKELEKRLQKEADELRAIAQENDLSGLSTESMSNKQVVNSQNALAGALMDQSLQGKSLSNAGQNFLDSQFKSGEMPLGPGGGAKIAVNVYRSLGTSGAVQYIGITNSLARRAAEHLASKGIQIEKIMGGLSRNDARAVEQALIQLHGLGRNGGTLFNKINSIAGANPTYARQLKRGLELLKKAGY